MSIASNPIMSGSPGGEPVSNPPQQRGLFSRIGAVLKTIAPYVQPVADRLAAAAGNYAPMELERQQREDALKQSLTQSQLQNQDLTRQLTQKQLDNYQTPDQQRAAAVTQAGALEDIRNLHAPEKDINTPQGLVGESYDPTANRRVLRPRMMTTQVPNPALQPYKDAAAGNPPNLVMDWNAGPPPTMPATVPQEYQIQLAAAPRQDTSITPYEDARRGAPQTPEGLSKFAQDWQQTLAGNKNVNTGEDLKNRIAVAYEKGDSATVQKLQTELKAIDPFGAERLADANQRLQDAQARTEEAQRQFQPAIAGSVVQATSTQDSVRRLMGILAPYKDDNAPFGSFMKQMEYKVGRAQTDAIGQELAGINLSGLQQAASVLKSMGGVRAVQALNLALAHTPDPTKDSVMLMYQKMQNIDRSIATFLSDADKYGRKKATDIEPYRMSPYGTPPAGPIVAPTLPKVPPSTADEYLRSIQQ